MNNVAIQDVHPILGMSAAVGADKAYQGRWVVIQEDGQLLGPDETALDAATLELRFGYLTLRAPGMLRLDVPLDVLEDDPSVIENLTIAGEPRQAVDEGAWASAWFTQVLGRPARLMKILAED